MPAIGRAWLALGLCAQLWGAATAPGAVLRVRQDGSGNYTTIQACVNAMSPGDTCLVGPGCTGAVALPSGNRARPAISRRSKRKRRGRWRCGDLRLRGAITCGSRDSIFQPCQRAERLGPLRHRGTEQQSGSDRQLPSRCSVHCAVRDGHTGRSDITSGGTGFTT